MNIITETISQNEFQQDLLRAIKLVRKEARQIEIKFEKKD